MAYWYILAFIVGLAVGSFLNVVIYRFDDLKSILNTRSRCNACRKQIVWYDLIPVISFVLLRGRCRKCKEQISWQYPLIELSTAIIFLLLVWYFGMYWLVILYALIYALLIIIFVQDVKTKYIYDIFSWSLLIVSLICGAIFFRYDIIDFVWGIVAGGAILGALVLVSKEKWMGLGDVFVGASLGAILGGKKALLMIFLSFVIGSIYGLWHIATKKTNLKQSLPFTPFLIIASLISLLLGDYIIDWYLGYIYLY